MFKTEQALGETTQRALAVHVDNWINSELSTRRADRNASEEAVKEAYKIVGLSPPSRFLWLDSPMSGAIAAGLATRIFQSVHNRVWKQPQEFMTAKFWSKIKPSDTSFWQQIQDHLNQSTLMVLRNGLLTPVARLIVQLNHPASYARGTLFVGGRRNQSAMPSQLWSQTATRLRAQLSQGESGGINFAPTWEAIGQQVRFCSFGSMDAQFLAFLDYCHKSGYKLNDVSALVSLAHSCGWWWPFGDFCIVTDRPTKITLSNDGNLHSDKGYAIEYADRWGIYALNGSVVPRSLARFAGNMRIQDIEYERNLEVRRRMIDMYGIDRFILDSGAEKVQEDSCGVLYRKTLMGDEAITMVKVINSTPEPDGTYKEYFLRVPPHIQSAREAVAWSFGILEQEYEPEAQT